MGRGQIDMTVGFPWGRDLVNKRIHATSPIPRMAPGIGTITEFPYPTATRKKQAKGVRCRLTSI